jgi:hypothetical protein
VYIATLDASHCGTFRLFKDIINEEKKYGEKIWGMLGNIHHSPSANDFDALETQIKGDVITLNFIHEIATLDILTRILRLKDLLNNAENFGFLQKADVQYPILKVIDFRVMDEIGFTDFEGFLNGNGMFNYASSHRTMGFVLHDRKKDARRETALQLFSRSPPLLNIRDHINHAYNDIFIYIEKLRPDLTEGQEEKLKKQLLEYCSAVLNNAEYFVGCLNDRNII